MNFNSIQDVNTFLNSIPKFSSKGTSAVDFSLDRFKRFCKSIGNPQNKFPSIHVAGSNGKGSTCRFIESIYRNAGYKTGLYTSPHLMNVRERFKIEDKQISKEDLIIFFQNYASLVTSFRLTYFEITTAIAFWWFAHKKVDIVIIETGLGGRLDATNVIFPLVSVITSITLDHTDILGDTIEAIAGEKAGIIKPKVPVVVGKLPSPAMRIIHKVASQEKSQVNGIVELEPKLTAGTFSIKTGKRRTSVSVSFRAPVQADNAAMAWRVCILLRDQLPVDDQQIKRGIQKTKSHGRFEKLHPSHEWYFDGAHNVKAVQALKKAVDTIGSTNKAVLVLSLMEDKINKKLVKEFLEFKKIYYHTLTTERGASFKQVNNWVSPIEPFPADQARVQHMLEELKNELVIFAGSFYFYPTVKKWISTFI